MRRDVDVNVEMIIYEKLYELYFYIEIKYYNEFNNI